MLKVRGTRSGSKVVHKPDREQPHPSPYPEFTSGMDKKLLKATGTTRVIFRSPKSPVWSFLPPETSVDITHESRRGARRAFRDTSSPGAGITVVILEQPHYRNPANRKRRAGGCRGTEPVLCPLQCKKCALSPAAVKDIHFTIDERIRTRRSTFKLVVWPRRLRSRE